MYFTESELLEYEKMMQATSPGRRLAELSSSNLPLTGSVRPVPNKMDEEKEEPDECGQ